MESCLDNPDARLALEKLRMNKNECESLKQLAAEAGKNMSEVQVEEIKNLKAYLEEVAITISIPALRAFLKQQSEIDN